MKFLALFCQCPLRMAESRGRQWYSSGSSEMKCGTEMDKLDDTFDKTQNLQENSSLGMFVGHFLD